MTTSLVWTEISALVLRAQAGDRAAYGELVERCQGTIYALALQKLRNPNEAQELTQEVFLHALNKLAQLRDVQCFVGWLRQITVRMAINRLTRRGPFQGVEPEILEQTQAQQDSPLDELVRSEQRTALHTALATLKPLDRQTLIGFYLQGRSIEQLSQEQSAPVGTIKRRLHVARKRLKKRLEKAGDKLKPTSNRNRELACV